MSLPERIAAVIAATIGVALFGAFMLVWLYYLARLFWGIGSAMWRDVRKLASGDRRGFAVEVRRDER